MRKYVRSAALLLTGTLLGISLSSLMAQTSKVTQIPPPSHASVASASMAPQIVSGSELGLRVDGQRGDRVVGTLVAKVGGAWVEVQFAPQDAFAKMP